MTTLFVLATICCLVDIVASIIIKFIIMCCFSETKDEQELRKNLISLKTELNSISMVDEFSRYAKLQRTYNKLQDEAKVKISTRQSSRIKLRMSLTYGIRVLNGILTSILVFMYRHEPVIVFPSGSLWPLTSFLSWPTNVDSCISLPSWIILMKLTVSSYYRLSAS